MHVSHPSHQQKQDTRGEDTDEGRLASYSHFRQRIVAEFTMGSDIGLRKSLFWNVHIVREKVTISREKCLTFE